MIGRKARTKTGKEGSRTAKAAISIKSTAEVLIKEMPCSQLKTAMPVSSLPKKGKKKKGKKKTLRTAAVVITCPPGEYKEVLREAVGRIDLASLEIGGMMARKAVTGAQIYEIGGPEKEKKADALATKLREVVGQRVGVRISRPTMTAEVRIRGLDESIVPADIVRAVAMNGGCSPEDVKSGEIQFVGKGPGTAWVRCPLAAANKIVAARTIQVGWIRARVEALEKRALQCFKCLKMGHTIAQCNGPDRSNLCYRCGLPGHVARDCRAPEHCPVCADLGRPAAHRAGTKPCASPKGEKKKGGPRRRPPPPAQEPPLREDKGPGKEEASTPSTSVGGVSLLSHKGERG